MALALFALALVALGALAYRFGADSRPGISGARHDLAWRDPGPLPPRPHRARITTRASRRVAAGIPVRSPSGVAPEPAMVQDPYPVLGALDRAAGSGAATLASSRRAAMLEYQGEGAARAMRD